MKKQIIATAYLGCDSILVFPAPADPEKILTVNSAALDRILSY